MVEVLVEKTFGGCQPASEEAMKVLSRIGVGAKFVVDVKDPRRRSTEQHNFWFAMVNTMFESQQYIADFNHFRRALLVKIGYRHEYHFLDGTTYYEPESLKFGNMSQERFTGLVDDTLTFAESMGFDREELLKHTREYTGQAA